MTSITDLHEWLGRGAARITPTRGRELHSRRGDAKRAHRLELIQGGLPDTGHQRVKLRKAERRWPDRPPEPPEAA